jgi:hypothetical protein
MAAAAVAGFFLAGILSMLRFKASMMSTTLPLGRQVAQDLTRHSRFTQPAVTRTE